MEEFAAAIRLGSKTENERLENDEVECLLANMIYKVCIDPSIRLAMLPQACLAYALSLAVSAWSALF